MAKGFLKAFFAASPVSKPILLLLLLKDFSFDCSYEMLIPLYHINMDIFLLRLLVVPHLLFPIFQIFFFKFFNKNVYFK